MLVFNISPPLSFECFTHVSTQSCFPWSSERCYSISTQCQFTISGLRNFFPTGFTPLIPWIKCFTNTPQRHDQTQLGREHDAFWIFSLHTALDCTHTTTVYRYFSIPIIEYMLEILDSIYFILSFMLMMWLGFRTTTFLIRLDKDSVTTNMAEKFQNIPSKVPSFSALNCTHVLPKIY